MVCQQGGRNSHNAKNSPKNHVVDSHFSTPRLSVGVHPPRDDDAYVPRRMTRTRRRNKLRQRGSSYHAPLGESMLGQDNIAATRMSYPCRICLIDRINRYWSQRHPRATPGSSTSSCAREGVDCTLRAFVAAAREAGIEKAATPNPSHLECAKRPKTY